MFNAQSKTPVHFTLESERLILRHLREDDVDAIFAFLGDPVAMQYYPKRFTREDAFAWIERNQSRYREDGFGIWAAVLKSSGQVIGDCGIVWQVIDDETMLEVGYHLRRDCWGRGFATEAALACIDYAFRELGAERIVSLIRPENGPSRRVAERNGMQAQRQVIHSGLPHLLYEVRR